MSDRMHPISFVNLLNWITGEYLARRSVFQIPEYVFFRKRNRKSVKIFNREIDTALGPAAGPHTQLAQNIVTAYLAGGRFIELKTVQKLDSLEIDKPCIDARDEGYNTEWSTELSLEQAYDEYLKGWVVLHFLEKLFGLSRGEPADNKTAGAGSEKKKKPSFIFNMSIGYDLEGIRTEPMDRFINLLIDSSGSGKFTSYLEQLDSFIKNSGFFSRAGLDNVREKLKDLPSSISSGIADSVTLSTMHGCPPDEIESICSYLLEQKKLHTFVKLNPTLLGFKKVRGILDKNGYDYIKLNGASFANDLQYDDAVSIITRLKEKAEGNHLGFGVKLSNTLGTVNSGEYLPGNEMYMSGRALFPLTVRLAYELSKKFAGNLPVSYSGGASQLNVKELYRSGIKPVTFATELLKPGGYLRLKEAADLIEEELTVESKGAGASDTGSGHLIKLGILEKLAENAEDSILYKKKWRGEDRVSVSGSLPMLDCYIAPCREACPIHQDIPQYISLTAEAEYSKSLELIYSRNALPNITGYICEQPCAARCTRLDYEGPVRIRDVKKIAAGRGLSGYKNVAKQVKAARNIPRGARGNIAVLGAGPSGLAVSYFLAKAGLRVSVYEERESAGGIMRNILPEYRLSEDALRRDISLIESLGVKFHFGVSGITPAKLKKEGFDYVFIGVGAQNSRKLKLKSGKGYDSEGVLVDALDFLRKFNKDPDSVKPGKKVAVIGGGNTAMDSARSALRIPGVEEVTVYYRRTEKEMPADREEYRNVVKEGGRFGFLLAPESVSSGDTGSILTLRKMKPGEKDASGRRRPVPLDEYENVKADTIISAIGETVDYEMLKKWGLKFNREGKLDVNKDTLETTIPGVYIGGDALRGPSSVVESIADGKLAAVSILKKVETGLSADISGNPVLGSTGVNMEGERLELIQYARREDTEARIESIYKRKGRVYNIGTSPDEEPDSDDIADMEGERCLQCDFLCNKCVDVCPNRANIAVPVKSRDRSVFKDYFQILHIDSLCNECGNCAAFCPWEGAPYKDKFTLFHGIKDFRESTNSGFMIDPENPAGLIVRIGGKTVKVTLRDDNTIENKKMYAAFRSGDNSDGDNSSGDSSDSAAGLSENDAGKAVLFMETVLKDYSYLFKL
ncbi:MAG: putative selenate reductase subunit YgfK [Spirochaetes bacterium]|nr:putative selenate reductase subunit YgfK [Spirochaetota bacterium]